MTKRAKFRRKFDTEFKVQAVKMILEDHLPVVEVAKRLNINQTQLHNWKQEFLEEGKNAFPGQGNLKKAEEELRQLRKRLADAEEERDILKKAVAIFSQTRDRDTDS